MPTITIDKTVYRHDSTVLPLVAQTGITGFAIFKLKDWVYFRNTSSSFTFQPPNKTALSVPFYLRDGLFPTFTLSTGVTRTTLNQQVRNTGSEGWKGAYYATPLSGVKFSIEGSPTTADAICGISLQDSSNSPIEHNYTDSSIAHALLFNGNGQIEIYEQGAKKRLMARFDYVVGDKGLIEHYNGVVRYYGVRADGTMTLLKTSRSLLTTTVIAQILVYSSNATINNVLIWAGSEHSVSLETIGVATRVTGEMDWQAWENVRQLVSSADPIQMADNQPVFSYPSPKTRLIQISLTPKSYTPEALLQFEDFFYYHGNEHEFIFVDYARRDVNGNPQEFWARMVSPFTDSTKNGCVFDHSVQISETTRSDYVPRETA